MLAKLTGQKSLGRATEWLHHLRVALVKQFDLRRARLPCYMTYSNVLAQVDGVQPDAILSAFFEPWQSQSRCAEELSRLLTPQGHADHSYLAIDGKALRVINSQEHPVHQLSCYEVATDRVLWHCNVQEKHNAHQRTQAVLDISVGQRAHLELRCHAHATRVLCASASARRELSAHC